MNYRAKIKIFAKDRLSSKYGIILAAMVLAALPFIITNILVAALSFFSVLILRIRIWELVPAAITLESLANLITCSQVFLYPFFVVGVAAFMLSVVRGKSEKVVFPYTSGVKNYAVKTWGIFLQTLFISLWSLLFVIPGIVKGYSYYFNAYILSDCPNLTARQALKLSKKITHGIKGDLFLFDLSFIGWWLLTALTCGILGLYTIPYYETAKASLYESMKNNALLTGKITDEDLNPPSGY